MSDETYDVSTYDVVIAGYADIETAKRDFDALVAIVSDKNEIADAPEMGRERVHRFQGGGSFEEPQEGRASAYVLSLDGKWFKCTGDAEGQRAVGQG